MNAEYTNDLNSLYKTTAQYICVNDTNKKCGKNNYKKYLEKYDFLKGKFKNNDFDSQDTLRKVKEHLDEIKFWECF